MASRPPLWILVLLIMFPQLVETIYSPALPNIALSFNITNERAAQTLSVYFFAFAIGVALWGRLSDVIGRRPAMILGLIIYASGSLLAIVAQDFNVLLFARMISALGAAAGSVVVQTMLRDSYESIVLAKVFSIMGAAVAVSPVFGLISGGWIVSLYGHMGIFIGLTILAIILILLVIFSLPETRPTYSIKQNIMKLSFLMAKDTKLWLNAILVSLFNTMIFSYYSLGPFLFERLGWESKEFGWTGLALAISALFASYLNRRLLAKSFKPEELIQYACLLSILSSVFVFVLQNSLWVIVPILGVVMAYSIAIPNLLSQALISYRAQAGTAGALFGFIYYFLLSLMLAISGLVQNLGLVLIVCAITAYLCKSNSINFLRSYSN
jgi:Bcr/CflA subfamily drug resistance transporter